MLLSKRKLSLALITLIGLSIGGLTEAKARLGDDTPKDFLTSYAHLKPVKGQEGRIYRYVKTGVDFSKYKRILIDPIRVSLKKDAEDRNVDPRELDALATYFRTALEKALGDAYPVVTEPGPDVLRFRLAVTDLVPNKPEASVISFAVPFLWVGEAGAGVAEGEAGSTPFIGEATLEFEALDSRTSKQLAAYIERHIAKKYNWTEGIDKAVGDYLKAYSTWAYTEQAMDRWAQGIRRWLDRVHGKARKP